MVDNPNVKNWLLNARDAADRLTNLLEEIDQIIFEFDDSVNGIISVANNSDPVQEDNPPTRLRTVAELRALYDHLKLLNIAGSGNAGITGITALQAHGNTLGNNFNPKTSRRRFHTNSFFR